MAWASSAWFMGDGNLGIWGRCERLPGRREQRCWNHKIVNVLDKLPKKVQPQAKRRLQDIAYAESRPEAEEKRDMFLEWCRKEGYRAAGDTLVRDWERMVTFYQFPRDVFCDNIFPVFCSSHFSYPLLTSIFYC